MGTIRRAAVAAAALAATALGQPVDAAPQSLAGVTYIHGARAAYADVRLPKAVTLATPFGGGPDLQVAGAARLAAFVLVGTDSNTRGVTLAGGETTIDSGSLRFLVSVPDGTSGGTYEETKTFGDTTTLPAGSYRVYVLANGPATIVLRLRGLPGSTSVRPVRPATGSLTSTVPDVYEPAPVEEPRSAFATTATGELARRGFALQALRTRAEAEAAWQVVMCRYDPATETVPGVPGCPNGREHTVVNHRAPSAVPADRVFVQAYAGLPAGRHGLSTVHTSESATTMLGYSVLWLSY